MTWWLVLVIIVLIAIAVLYALRLHSLAAPLLAMAVRGGGETHAPPVHDHVHPVGDALGDYVQSLTAAHAVRDPAEGGAGATGGFMGVAGGAKKASIPPPKRPWTEYATWEQLQEDAGATAEYFATRNRVLASPDLDWTNVLKKIVPKLQADREYIGTINLGADMRTLELNEYEASPVVSLSSGKETEFASVPSSLVEKHARRPALFIFHTHPADPRCSPLPSSTDLSTAIYFASLARFAGSVVISRYGALVYGLDPDGYAMVARAKNWQLAVHNLSHDVVASHEAVRSWARWTLADYIAFYPRHRLFFIVFPTPAMVSDSRHEFMWDLESPIDHELIQEHQAAIRQIRSLQNSHRWLPPMPQLAKPILEFD